MVVGRSILELGTMSTSLELFDSLIMEGGNMYVAMNSLLISLYRF